MPRREGIYGLLAEFNTPGELVHATEQARAAGYRRMECYTPYPVEEAAEAMNRFKNLARQLIAVPREKFEVEQRLYAKQRRSRKKAAI